AQQTFIAEARELLQVMEQSLLQLESEPGDEDAIGAVFRAAHTIKGSAGLFGLAPIVGFTHIVEDVLDRLRDGSVKVDAALIALLLKCGDHILDLIEAVDHHGGALQPATLEHGEVLREALSAYQPLQMAITAVESAGQDDETRAEVLWHISLRFGAEVFRNGMDPLSFLRYLATLGQLLQVTPLTERIPPVDAWDPESCYLGFEIDLRSNASHATLNEVFDFVRDDCEVLISALDAPGDSSTAAGTELVTQTLASPVATTQQRVATTSEVKPRDGNYVRVNADKLDELINLVGELVIA
ncbi:chemotaxis protein CheA, partial [Corynebacterium pseudodiphtheriticum]